MHGAMHRQHREEAVAVTAADSRIDLLAAVVSEPFLSPAGNVGLERSLGVRLALRFGMEIEGGRSLQELARQGARESEGRLRPFPARSTAQRRSRGCCMPPFRHVFTAATMSRLKDSRSGTDRALCAVNAVCRLYDEVS